MIVFLPFLNSSKKRFAMKRWIALIIFLSAVHCVNAQDSINKKPVFKFTAEAAPEWTRLFERTSGWFGADGIFSIPLSGVDKNNNAGNDSTLLIFSDTYIGEVKDGRPVRDTMVNNTIAYIKGNDADASKIHFLYSSDANGKPISFFTPRTS